MIRIIMLCMIVSSCALFQPVAKCKNFKAMYVSKDYSDFSRKLNLLNARINYVGELARSIKSCGIDQNLMLSMIKVESDFVVGAYNSKSADYGLMQINHYHVRRLKLSVKFLLTDVTYNVMIGCKILGWFISKYELAEAIGRYNAGTAAGVMRWESVKKYVKRVMYYKTLLDMGGGES